MMNELTSDLENLGCGSKKSQPAHQKSNDQNQSFFPWPNKPELGQMVLLIPDDIFSQVK